MSDQLSQPLNLLVAAGLQRLAPTVESLRRDGWDAGLYVEADPPAVELRLRLELARTPIEASR